MTDKEQRQAAFRARAAEQRIVNEELRKTVKFYLDRIENGRMTIAEALTLAAAESRGKLAEQLGKDEWISCADMMPDEVFYDSDGSEFVDKKPRPHSESDLVLCINNEGTYTMEATRNGQFSKGKDADNFPVTVMAWKPFTRINYNKACDDEMRYCHLRHTIHKIGETSLYFENDNGRAFPQTEESIGYMIDASLASHLLKPGEESCEIEVFVRRKNPAKRNEKEKEK